MNLYGPVVTRQGRVIFECRLNPLMPRSAQPQFSNHNAIQTP